MPDSTPAPPPALTAELDDPGFTPGAAHFPALFALLATASREEAPDLERVLARGGERALEAILSRLSLAEPTERARLVSVLGRLADPRAREALERALFDADARVARRAANALGKLEFEPASEAALRRAWTTTDLPLKRTLAEALGKVGGPDARALLASAAPTDPADPELARISKKALLLWDRRHRRGETSAIVTDRPLGGPFPLLARCRAGLSALLEDELAALGAARATSPSLVELSFRGRLEELFVARTALDFGVRIELELRAGDLASAVAEALAGPTARAVLGAWTDGTARYRLTFSEGGHQRALLFELVEAVARRVPLLVNDSRAPSWEVVVVQRPPAPYLVLLPVAYEDPRFAYRKRDVRAASHPTLAAALARTAGVRANDVVWDPFLGSGLELIERARLGPCQKLLGSDLDPAALDAARANLAAADVTAELRVGDATELRPAGVTLILTNPPMGRRLLRDSSLAGVLDAFVRHAARVLAPGGRLVWLSPLPERTRHAAAAVGFVTTPGRLVDMGGFEAELQTFRRR